MVTSTRPLALSAGALTDVGRRRSANEDSLLAEHPVYIVADGMGGHEAGDLASAAVVDAFRPLVGRDGLTPEDVVAAVITAHRSVHAIAQRTQRGAGSTLTGMVCVEQDGNLWWLVVNVGDSRVYRLLGNTLQQITVDHSVAQEMVERGQLLRSEMSSFQGRNVITRAMGDVDSEAEYWLLPVVTGERLLICSDGLTGELPDETLRAGLALGGSTEQTVANLIAQANERGGRDNISAVVVDVLAGGMSPDADDVTGALAYTSTATAASSRRAHMQLGDPSRSDEFDLDEDTAPSTRRRSTS